MNKPSIVDAECQTHARSFFKESGNRGGARVLCPVYFAFSHSNKKEQLLMSTNSQRTLVLVKPNAVRGKHSGDIIRRFEESGLTLRRLKAMQMGAEFAGEFYAEHIGKPFYAGLVGFMTSGAVVAMELEGDNAIQKVRDLI